ncbi:hypothetical protein GCM10007872_29630 [Gluconobacter sphaericus NBRC 12467]|uniref:Uncharacterized protein n=1 Tax=Gluconobacter sphaericus NBRC 12467 TaxID=1307951 RepID=A0AA37SKE0_9PROT|nr:hypothetical protein AA12467_0927 [Gluconobacter sphaericus NBRC 12467]GEB42850.1 hypothetical protein GSP01_16320 [Gluconobacter sphaericus NBRC 12467]GLQ86053.1 hypothetical protein GCM10007872_29630 [Gluconobacter sphaericus NBRC 12467]
MARRIGVSSSKFNGNAIIQTMNIVFFGTIFEERLARLSGPGDQLEAFSRTVDFEVFYSGLFNWE